MLKLTQYKNYSFSVTSALSQDTGSRHMLKCNIILSQHACNLQGKLDSLSGPSTKFCTCMRAIKHSKIKFIIAKACKKKVEAVVSKPCGR